MSTSAQPDPIAQFVETIQRALLQPARFTNQECSGPGEITCIELADGNDVEQFDLEAGRSLKVDLKVQNRSIWGAVFASGEIADRLAEEAVARAAFDFSRWVMMRPPLPVNVTLRCLGTRVTYNTDLSGEAPRVDNEAAFLITEMEQLLISKEEEEGLS